jgi:hypothetical protein
MSEPVKVVIVIEGGVISTVLSCGVPVRAVIIDYDEDGEDKRNIVRLPQLDGSEAEGYAWEILVEADEPAYPLALFNMGAWAGGVD